MLTYTIRDYGEQSDEGSSQPIRGALDAIFKQDNDEAPFAIYNEYVAQQLAGVLGVPVAQGVLVIGRTGMLFGSLVLALAGLPIPDISAKNCAQVYKRYPALCAGLLVFDLWIGNWDRADNLKGNIGSSPMPLLFAFDHALALLGFAGTPDRSMADLAAGEPGAGRTHLFSGMVAYAEAASWIARVRAMTPERVFECCVSDGTIGGVTLGVQRTLAEALLQRRKHLDGLVRAQCR